MGSGLDLYIIFLFLAIFLILVYFINKNINQRIKTKKFKKRDLMILRWRISICFTVLLIALILFLNKDSLEIALRGTFNIFLLISLLIFFVSFIGIIIIDLLLPTEMEIWKRVLIEMSLFLTLCVILIILIKITWKMQDSMTVIIVVLFLLIFGCLLYIFTTFLFRLFEEADIERRTKKIWIWRASIFLVIAYISLKKY